MKTVIEKDLSNQLLYPDFIAGLRVYTDGCFIFYEYGSSNSGDGYSSHSKGKFRLDDYRKAVDELKQLGLGEVIFEKSKLRMKRTDRGLIELLFSSPSVDFYVSMDPYSVLFQLDNPQWRCERGNNTAQH